MYKIINFTRLKNGWLITLHNKIYFHDKFYVGD